MQHELLINNGLIESTNEDKLLYEECLASAVPITAMWDSVDDAAKFIQWDDSLEKYLAHRAALLDHEGREKFMPYNLYESLGVQWLNGYNYIQKIGDCSSMGMKNSLKASDLVNAKLTGRQAVEIHPSVTYSYARGNGQFRWGSGANLSPCQKYAAELGNFAAEDYGRYTGQRPSLPNANQKANAIKHQSIIIPLPDAKFETVWALCAAGIGICIGSSTFPSSSQVNSDGLGVASGWSSGAHATGICGALEVNGTRYLWWENSHGNKYKVGKTGHPSGCFITKNDLTRLANGAFRYGTWFGNVGELVRL